MKKVIVTIFFFFGLAFISHAQNPTNIKRAMKTIKIGDTCCGGIVFYVDDRGIHGLAAAEKDLKEIYDWQDATGILNNFL